MAACPRVASAGGWVIRGLRGGLVRSTLIPCSASATEKAYISRTQPSFSLDSGSASMWAVNHSQSGITCKAPNSVQTPVLCCAVLCCAVLYCAVLCWPVLACAVLCCPVLCCAVLACAGMCCAVLCCAVLCCAGLCCAVLCCAVLCPVLPCCALPCRAAASPDAISLLLLNMESAA